MERGEGVTGPLDIQTAGRGPWAALCALCLRRCTLGGGGPGGPGPECGASLLSAACASAAGVLHGLEQGKGK